MSESLTVTKRIHFSMANKGKREIEPGPQPILDTPQGRIPRVSRLMALAIKFDHLLASGAVRDQAELAELGHVSRARVTQIMNLLHLAPDIQEEILFLPRVSEGRDPITERHLRHIAADPDWKKQRRLWQKLVTSSRLARAKYPHNSLEDMRFSIASSRVFPK
ncbi:MAG: hypothetical protein KAV00_13870 [Phycisphaerae bacterium]|nr:hypothetical protein [Phycisphaerae bacterium]